MQTRRKVSPEGRIAGRLEGIDLPDLIWSLARARKTGVLGVKRYPIHKTLHFQDGRVIFASSSDPNDRLGETLLRQGKVTLRQLEVALSQLGTGKRIGTLLVEAGILTREALSAAVLAQLESIYVDLLTWEEGEYSFNEGNLPTQESITIQARSSELLLQGIRSIQSFSKIRRGAGPPRTVFALSEGWREQSEDLGLTEGEKQILERLTEGEQSLEQLCREIAMSSFEIHRSLWAFKLLGLVETRGQLPKRQDRQTHEGNLAETSFAQLLVRLAHLGESGVLYVRRGGVERSFHFGGGRCVFATSTDPDDGLITYLFRRGVISLSDREETCKRLLTNKRVGTILREMGVIDDTDLREMVRLQVAEVVYDTFRWVDGDYVFVPGPLPSAEKITLNEHVAAIVAAGIRRVGSWTRVIQGCGGLDNPLCLAPSYLDILDAMGAGVAEWEVVSAIKSPQTPRRACNLSELGAFRVCQILWTLKLLGAVEDSPVEMDETAPVLAEEPPAAIATVDPRPSAADEAVEADTETFMGTGRFVPSVDPEAVDVDAESADWEAMEDDVDPAAWEAAEAADESAGWESTQAETVPEMVDEEHDPFVDDEDTETATTDTGAGEPTSETAEPLGTDEAFPVEAGDVGQPSPGVELRDLPPTRTAADEEHRPEPEFAAVAALATDTQGLGFEEGAAPQAVLEPRLADDDFADEREPEAEQDEQEEFVPDGSESAETTAIELPPGVEENILRFNAMHRIVYRAVRSEIGAGAANFVRSCCAQLSQDDTDPVDGVGLHADGSWDTDGLKRVIVDKQIDDPWPAYQRVLECEFTSLEPHLGDARSQELRQKILEIEEAAVR